MLQFTNGFFCAMDNENGDIIIKFMQQAPGIDETGNMAEVKTEEVVTLVMGKMMAHNLSQSLAEILETEEKEA